jgi:maltose alpha-D-glucosyltransferase / alpha-amylase
MTAIDTLAFKQALEAALPTYLHTCRWYGDKSGEIVAVEWFELGSIALDGARLRNGIISVTLADSEQSWYALPVVVDPAPSGLTPITRIQTESGLASICDAIEHPLFAVWLMQLLRDPDHAESNRLGATWSPTSALDHFENLPNASQFRVSRAEQSNSSIVFGDQIMVKIFRKLRSGISPDVEVGRFLTEETTFESMPPMLGELKVLLPDDGQASLGVAQSFVASEADGWHFALNYLTSFFTENDNRIAERTAWLASMRLLGETTANLHLELGRSSSNRDFNPEPIVSKDILDWEREVEVSLQKVIERLRRLNPSDSVAASLIEAFLESVPRLEVRAARFDRLLGTSKTRVHGDFHLGQTLRTPDGKFVILDFEGEPLRPIAERRAKTSPLRDVAGMFRSFNYARGVTERSSTRPVEDASILVRWERETRDAFLGGYLDRARDGHARFLPDSAEDVREALAAWELHKALYEILYELDNRPSWMVLPLAATLKLA